MGSQLRAEVEAELRTHIIPFWNEQQDLTHGGFYGEVDYQLNVHKEADKGVILNSRILWFYSKAYAILGEESLLELATHGYQFLVKHCWDDVYGGVFWSVDYKGKPVDTIKHTYNQAFAIYALSAYYGVTKEQAVLDKCMQLFQLIEEKCKDAGGYLECFTRSFEPMENDKLSENGVIAERTMNTLLHVFEGYSGLYEVSKSEVVGTAMRGILHLFLEKIYNADRKRQEVFFNLEYQSLLDLHSYGHDIESAWLIEWGCALLGEQELLEKIQAIGSQMVEHVYQEAYCKSGVLNECEDGIQDTTRVWWVQAEAILGFVNEWKKHPEATKYYDAAVETWEFVKAYLIDQRNGGEWFSDLDNTLQPTSRKSIVEPWKCPYHNGRMCLTVIQNLSNIDE